MGENTVDKNMSPWSYMCKASCQDVVEGRNTIFRSEVLLINIMWYILGLCNKAIICRRKSYS